MLLDAFSIFEEAAPEAVSDNIACRIAMLLNLANARAATRPNQKSTGEINNVMSDRCLADEQFSVVLILCSLVVSLYDRYLVLDRCPTPKILS